MHSQARKLLHHPITPYAAPFIVFLAVTLVEGQGASQGIPELVLGMYTLKTVLVASMLFAWRKSYPELRSRPSFGLLAVASAAGLAVFAIWVLPEDLLRRTHLGSDTAFDPHVFSPWPVAAFAVAVRLCGAALVVPFMEELFWRSFLPRFVMKWDFRSVAVGSFTPLAFAITAVLFGLEHNRVIVGIVAGVIFNGLLAWRRNLLSCVVAHGVANFALGAYVLATSRYEFW